MKILFKVMFSLLCLSIFAYTAPSKSDEIDKYTKQYEKDFRKLSQSQLDLLKAIYKKGKEFSLEYSVMAIAWQESNAGAWPVNLQDPSCGPFHQSVSMYIRARKLENTNFNKNKVCSRLINDLDFSTSAAIYELEAWMNVHRNKLNLFDYVYRSYNAGTNYESKTAKTYSNKIIARIRVLKANKHLFE